MFCKDNIKKIIQNSDKVKILVIGDFVLDEMIYGTSHKISREAPVLVLRHTKTDNLLGAASNASNNISKLNGGKVTALGVIGLDYHGTMLKDALEKANIDITYLLVDETRATTTKTRISGASAQSVKQQIVRIDRETTEPLSEKTEQKIISKIKTLVPHYDGILLSDYGIGVITQKIIDETINTANKYGKITVVDSQKNLSRFKNATLLAPNQPDIEKTLGYKIKDKQTLLKAGQDLLNMTNSDKVLITRGKEGMILFEKNKNIVNIPAFNKTEVFDVTGAGDTVAACVILGICAGANGTEASVIGNLAASLVVRKFGAATTTPDELIANLEKLNPDNIEKFDCIMTT
ncbi:MAG: bifunctional hydroxymethylpyrimidine kinase/phosphomethylpyrimidine kinase [Candidatus Aenigmarchaeota archaeon]|nr:bifunctional hydroxymethylpyrimidine kinase/phosphomethylpyrimidine kinase [Candidatus Aenigmarchaeota archaeon]